MTTHGVADDRLIHAYDNIRRPIVSSLCFVATCTVVSAQEGCDATPHQAELDHARQFIRDASRPGQGGGALAVIRLVNCLHSLGKDQAVSLLREIAPAERMDRTMIMVVDPDCLKARDEDEHSNYLDVLWDAQRVCLIVPLLFEFEQSGTPPPATWYDKAKNRWSVLCSTIAIQDGIPFDIWGVWSMGGCPPEGTLPLVEWAAAHGKLRKEPLQPTDDPLRAADALHERVIAGVVPEFAKEYWMPGEDGMKAFRNHLRAQAIAMLPQLLEDRRGLSWEERREHFAHAGTHWDRGTQAYVIGGDPGNLRCSCPK